ncbi:GPI mannosyltransferase 2, partial [Phenoliferia sp. Uapishka_3]
MRSSESSIIALAVGARVATIALLTTAGRVLPAFDTSSQLQLNATGSLLEPLLRWDSLYFTSTALHGYQHEQQLAFMPGISLLARWGGRVVQLLRRGPVLSAQDVVLAGTLAAAFAGVGAALALHKLTLALHPSRSFALLTVVLFLLPPSPPTLNAIPYTEPFFALTTFLGMLLNVGPFRYWTVSQIPNFLLASPVLFLSLSASYAFYSRNYAHIARSSIPFLTLPNAPPASSFFLTPTLTPFIHLHTALTLLLLFASHVQIILRLCTSNPVVFWYAATLVEKDVANGVDGIMKSHEESKAREGRRWGRVWVGYCVVWGTVSTVLWAGFLPPA